MVNFLQMSVIKIVFATVTMSTTIPLTVIKLNIHALHSDKAKASWF